MTSTKCLFLINPIYFDLGSDLMVADIEKMESFNSSYNETISSEERLKCSCSVYTFISLLTFFITSLL